MCLAESCMSTSSESHVCKLVRTTAPVLGWGRDIGAKRIRVRWRQVQCNQVGRVGLNQTRRSHGRVCNFDLHGTASVGDTGVM